jgi:hypothetical protein
VETIGRKSWLISGRFVREAAYGQTFEAPGGMVSIEKIIMSASIAALAKFYPMVNFRLFSPARVRSNPNLG